MQCGFCTPGLVLAHQVLTDRARPMSRQEIAEALNGHVCRCTGYVKIIDAVELIFEAKRSGKSPELLTLGRVGESLARYQGAELVLGERPFVADIDAPVCCTGPLCFHRTREPACFPSIPARQPRCPV